MPDISFYLLSSEATQERYLFACKLVEKAYRSGCFCYVLTDSAEQSRIIDDLLWTFRAGSFIPHQLYTGVMPDRGNIILIGTLPAPSPTPENQHKTIVNLSAHCPENLAQTDRVLEILDNSETTKAAGRNRYRQYQQAGMAVMTHKM
jgi:DNA polymerase-3 subunit chi